MFRLNFRILIQQVGNTIRPEMARVLWRRADDGLAFAIAATLLCRSASKLDQRDTDIQLRYLEEAKWYEKNAVEIYQTAFNKNPSNSYKLLTRVQYQWGKRTVLELGVEGRIYDSN